MTVKVLLADDQRILRDGFRLILESSGEFTVVGEAADGSDAVDLARQLNPDVVLMDIRMQRVDGIEATKRIVTSRPKCRGACADHLRLRRIRVRRPGCWSQRFPAQGRPAMS
jgi:DNA-binding NarL/FixJ family response regulator